jgi:hypothetical protein
MGRGSSLKDSRSGFLRLPPNPQKPRALGTLGLARSRYGPSGSLWMTVEEHNDPTDFSKGDAQSHVKRTHFAFERGQVPTSEDGCQAVAAVALRCWKHSRQNTGRPCVGLNGTVVSFWHPEQMALVSTL